MKIRNTLRHLGSVLGLGIALTTILPSIEAAPAAYPIINEYVLSHPLSLPQVPSDTYKARLEVFSGTGGIPAATYTVVFIGGDSGRNANVGRIVQAMTLPATAANSYYCFPIQSDSGTRTIVIVTGYTGPLGNSISAATPGAQLTYVLPGSLTGTIPWTDTIDGVAVWDSGKNDITFETTVTKNLSATTVRLNPNFDTFNVWVQGASRNINATDNNLVADWIRNAPNGAGLDDAPPVTVGAFPLSPNPLTTPATFCFDNDNVPLPPEVVNDAFTVAEGGTFNSTIGTLTTQLGAHSVLANDSDPNLDVITVNQVGSSAVALNAANLGVATATSQGTVTVLADGTFVYAHNGSENFTDSFTYTITDGTYTSTTATVTITITPVNDNAPVANPDAYATDEDTTLNIAATGVLANDTDADVGTTLTVSEVNGAAINVGSPLVLGSGAIVTLNADGSFSYNPNGSFNALLLGGSAPDSFMYTVTDGTFTSSTTVTITVNGLNDCPDAVNDTNSTNEDVTINANVGAGVLANDTDPDAGALLNVTAVNGSGPAVGNPLVLASGAILTLNADGSYTYNPNGVYNHLAQGATANDSFTYTISDGTCTDSASVTITINGTNDCPTAVNDSNSVAENATLNVAASGLLGNDTDPDTGATKTITEVNGVGGNVGVQINIGLGALLTVNANGSYSFDPNGAYNGLNAGDPVIVPFTYTMSDTFCTSTATVNITINGVNNCPVAVADTGSTDENTSLVVPANGVLGNDTDADAGAALSVSAVNGVGANVGNPLVLASGATITLNANGSYTYNPNTAFDALDDGESTTDSFNYTVNDGTCTSSNTVTITINGANDCPVALPDAYSTDEDTSLVVPALTGVLSNDSDVDVEPLIITTYDAVSAKGVPVTLNADGSFTYATTGFQALDDTESDTDTFTYTLGDGTCTIAATTVTITINGLNDCPVALPDAYSTDEDTSLVVPVLTGVLSNDSDADVEPLIITTYDAVSAKGVPVTLNADGSFTYATTGFQALDDTESDTDTFTYTLGDGTCTIAATTVTITINGVNDCPVALPDAYSTDENTSLVVPALTGVLSNDSDVDVEPLIITTYDAVSAKGVPVTLNADGSFTYATTGFQGLDDTESDTDTFTYTIGDGTCTIAATTVTITINGTNDCPVALPDAYGTDENTSLVVPALTGVLSNDSDIDGDALIITTYDAVSAKGVPVTLNADGSFTYATTGFQGLDDTESDTDTFTYTIGDGTCTIAATTVTITINGLNDCPVALPDAYSIDEDTSLAVPALTGVLSNDSDVDVEPLIITTYDAVSVKGVPVTLNADGSFTYATTGFQALDDTESDTDTFTYTIGDGTCTIAATTVTITINGVNDCPVVLPDTNTINKITVLNVPAAGVLGNDTDVDDPLTVSEVNGVGANVGVPVNLVSGAIVTVNANGSYSYDPNGAFPALPSNGTTPDSFTYTATDGTCSASTTVTITVTGVNNCPTALNDSNSTTEDASVSSVAPGVLGNDSDIDPVDILSVTAMNGSGPAVGVATAIPSGALVTLSADGSYTYDPNGKYEGLDDGETASDSFTYTVSDGICTQNATVTITINGVNDCPVALPDAYSTDENTSLVVPALTGVLSNDSDVDVEPLVITTYDAVSVKGVPVTLNADGSFTYATTGFEALDDTESDTDTFTYTLGDGTCTIAATTVTITINGVNDCPMALPDAYSTDEDTSLVVPVLTGVLSNDSDADVEPLIITTYDAVSVKGVPVTLNADGSFTYATTGFQALDDGESDTDTFTYTIGDGTCTIAATTVTITINGLNDCPVALPDAYSTDEDTSLVVPALTGVLSNDSDVDVEPLIITTYDAVSAKGVPVTLNADGSFTYATTGFQALDDTESDTDTFTYTIGDGTCTIAATTVTITINGVNDCPMALPDAYSTDEDTSLVVPALTGVLSNDSDVDVEPLIITTYDAVSAKGVPVTLNADGSFTYATTGFQGLDDGETDTDTFTYTIGDGTCTIAATTVTITINGVNDCPVALPDAYSTDENTSLVVPVLTGVLSNDSDVDVEPLIITTYDAVSVKGVPVTLNADGSFTYATTGFQALDDTESDTDTFTYTIGDGTCTIAATTVTITINGVNDCPVALPDAYSTDEDTSLVVPALTGVLSNDSDVDVEPLIITTYDAVSAKGVPVTLNADGSFTYATTGFQALDDGESDTDTFTYTIGDGTCTIAATTVTITINGLNDCPVALPDAYSTDENTSLVVPVLTGVLSNDSDVDVEPLIITTYDAVSVKGVPVTLNADGSFTYATTGFEGLDDGESDTDTFTYTIGDGTCTIAATTVTITINGVNDCPVALPDAYSTDEDTSLVVPVLTGVLSNDSDADGDALIITTYDAVSAKGVPVTLNADGSFTYATTGFQGLGVGQSDTDTFTYTIGDGTCTIAATTVTITINGVNDCPIAFDDTAATDENTPLAVFAPGVLANDTDVDTSPLNTVVFAGFSTNGAAISINADGSFTYDPTPSVAIQALGDGAILVDTFDYTVTDGLCTDIGTVSITVTGVNEAPVANDDAYSTDEDTVLNVPATGVLANDSDADLDPITITLYDAVSAQGAAVVLNADGSFSYDPTVSVVLQILALGDSVIDTFTYTISDGSLSDSATVEITVNGKNDAPVPVAIRKTFVFPNGLWSPLNGQPAQNADVNLGDYWQPIVIPINDPDTDISLITVTEGVGKSPGGMTIKIDPPNTYAYDDARGYWTFNVLIPVGTPLATPIIVPLVISDGVDSVNISYTLNSVLTPRFPIARTMPRYYAEGVAFKDFVNAAPLSRSLSNQPTTDYTVNWWVAYSVARETISNTTLGAEDWHAYFINYNGTQSFSNDQVYWAPARFLNNQTRALESYLLSDGDDNVGPEESRLFSSIAVRGGLSFAFYGHVDIDPLTTMDYTNWKSYGFGADALTAAAAADQDFNADTVPNAVAYALGFDPQYTLAGVTTTQTGPTEWTITGLPVGLTASFTSILSNGDNWQEIAYQRNPQQEGVTYTIQYSEDITIPTPVWTDAPEGIANETNAHFGVHLYGNRVLVADQPWQLLESWQVNGRVKDINNQIKGLRLKIVYGGNTYIVQP